LLLEQRNCKNIFQLLKSEEKKIISRDSDLQFQDGPTLTWELTNFSENYYKESEPFIIDGHAFKLSIQYISEILQLKISTVDISILRNCSNKSGLPIDFFQSYRPKPDNILSAMYNIEIGDSKMDSSEIISLIEDGSTYVELVNWQDFEYEKYISGGSMIRIQLFFKLKYTHASIVSQIAKNFNFYHTDKGIKLLKESHLNFLYSFDYLEVMSEDQVLISFVNWFTQNHEEIGSLSISGILDKIRWNHVTIKTLHKMMIENKAIKEHSDMKRVFKNELERRLRELLQEREGSEMYGVYLQKREPRKSYFNFLRPETATYLFDFLYNKLLEVPHKEDGINLEIPAEESVNQLSKNLLTDKGSLQSVLPEKVDDSQNKLTFTRLRDRRKIFKKDDDTSTPQRKEYDDDDDGDLSDGNGMKLKMNKLTPINDNKKSNMKGLFKDDDSDGPEAGDNDVEYQNKHAYKGPPDMASIDIPNGTFGCSDDNTPSLNDPKAGINYNRKFESDEESSAKINYLFEKKNY
jgi:hypothetical protein